MLDDMYQQNIALDVSRTGTAIMEAAQAFQSPHVLMRPRIYPDGDKWCAFYGDDLQAGVVGFGDSPAEAAADFDRAWYGTKTS